MVANLAPTIRPGRDGLLLEVRVIPSSPQKAVKGLYGDRLKVSVSAPPEDNRANRELVEALAGWLGMRRDEVQVAAGHGSKDKVVRISGIEEGDLRERLADLLRESAGRKRVA